MKNNVTSYRAIQKLGSLKKNNNKNKSVAEANIKGNVVFKN